MMIRLTNKMVECKKTRNRSGGVPRFVCGVGTCGSGPGYGPVFQIGGLPALTLFRIVGTWR